MPVDFLKSPSFRLVRDKTPRNFLRCYRPATAFRGPRNLYGTSPLEFPFFFLVVTSWLRANKRGGRSIRRGQTLLVARQNHRRTRRTGNFSRSSNAKREPANCVAKIRATDAAVIELTAGSIVAIVLVEHAPPENVRDSVRAVRRTFSPLRNDVSFPRWNLCATSNAATTTCRAEQPCTRYTTNLLRCRTPRSALQQIPVAYDRRIQPHDRPRDLHFPRSTLLYRTGTCTN